MNTYNRNVLSITCNHWLKHWIIVKTLKETIFRNGSISNNSYTFCKTPHVSYRSSNALTTSWFLFSLPISSIFTYISLPFSNAPMQDSTWFWIEIISCNKNIAIDYLPNKKHNKQFMYVTSSPKFRWSFIFLTWSTYPHLAALFAFSSDPTCQLFIWDDPLTLHML